MLTDVIVVAGHVLHEVARHARLPQLRGESPCGAPRLRRRLQHHRVARGERRAHATCRDRVREVPWGHHQHDAARRDRDAVSGQLRDQLRALRAVVLREVDCLADFGIALAHRLAGFVGHHGDRVESVHLHRRGDLRE